MITLHFIYNRSTNVNYFIDTLQAANHAAEWTHIKARPFITISDHETDNHLGTMVYLRSTRPTHSLRQCECQFCLLEYRLMKLARVFQQNPCRNILSEAVLGVQCSAQTLELCLIRARKVIFFHFHKPFSSFGPIRF